MLSLSIFNFGNQTIFIPPHPVTKRGVPLEAGAFGGGVGSPPLPPNVSSNMVKPLENTAPSEGMLCPQHTYQDYCLIGSGGRTQMHSTPFPFPLFQEPKELGSLVCELRICVSGPDPS